MVKGPAGAIPLAGAAVEFREPTTGLPISYPLYPDGSDPLPLVLPYVTGDLGELEVWADLPHRVQITVTKNGLTQARETIDLEYPPEYGATDQDILNAILAHEAADDPHDQYLTEPEGNLLYLPLSHEPGTDPHPQYLKTSHEPGVDPHPQYLQTSIFTQPDPLGQYQLETEKGQPNGYAPLDPNLLIPTVHLPPLAITNTFVVASEAEMLALDAQTGDLAIRSDTGKSFILAADPASVLGNWKELSAAAPVLSVNGYVGVVNLTAADVGALTPAQATLDYVNVDGDAMTGPLRIDSPYTNALTVAGNSALDADRWEIGSYQIKGFAYGDPQPYLQLNANGEGIEFRRGVANPVTALTQANDGFLLLSGGGFRPNYEDTLDLGASSRRWQKLWAKDGDFSGALTVATKPVAVSPDPGNILSWLPNGFYASLTTANVTVLRRQEFSPPASSTSVTLSSAPNSVLEVSRNGVAQSAALGHYTVAGAVITFADPFSTGEQVQVLSEVGTSVPTDTYTKAESDARYATVGHLHTGTYLPLTGGTLTGALIMSGAGIGVSHAAGSPAFAASVTGDTFTRTQLSAGGVFSFGPGNAALDTTLTRTAAGQLRLSGAANSGLDVRSTGSASSVHFGQVAAGARSEWGTNVWFDGTNWQRDDVSKASAVVMSNDAYPFQVYSFPAGANPVSPVPVAKLTLNAAGTLSFVPDVASGAARGSAIAIQVAGAPAPARFGQVVTGGNPRLDITTNATYDGTNWNRENTAYGIGTMHLYGDPAADGNAVWQVQHAIAGANPATGALKTRLMLTGVGTLQITPEITGPPQSVPALSIPADFGMVVGHPVAVATIQPTYPAIQVGLSTLWANDGNSSAYWSCNSYYNGQGGGSGRHAFVNQAGGELAQEGNALIYRTYAAVAAGAQQTIVERFKVDGGAITWNHANGPALTVGAGAANNNVRVSSAAANSRLEAYGTGLVPFADGFMFLGEGAYRWASVWSSNGTIQTSLAANKHDFAPLDGAACVQAVLGTDWLSFTYNDPDPPPPIPAPPGETAAARAQREQMNANMAASYEASLEQTAYTRKQKGYVLQSDEYATDALFGLGGIDASPQSDLAVVACALQQALKDIADLKARLA